MSRSTVSKSDYDKAAAFLKKFGLRPIAMDVLPGKVRIETDAGDALTLPDDLAEINRRNEKWGSSGNTN